MKSTDRQFLELRKSGLYICGLWDDDGGHKERIPF